MIEFYIKEVWCKITYENITYVINKNNNINEYLYWVEYDLPQSVVFHDYIHNLFLTSISLTFSNVLLVRLANSIKQDQLP